eukprot:CAMPEP_0184979828 /NCGR_PEP_ID=MMETSP1098-20130426/9940_1 /TAXON_ID=89044 /ORGANISM="Spumella elongata, Strain CCAP 955/1" /LENGTH=319 /DNA_ID=CAMNT_0027503161 /DNA_START=63 /DNA_END=1022 /DNA_ORIENTATION=+
MFLAKVVREAKNETFCNEVFLWELDKEVTYCRDCRRTFSMSLRRHHCRNCGGIYCDECSLSNAEIRGVKVDRGCKGCIRGETPGDNVRIAVEKSLSLFDTRGNRKVTCANVALVAGSPFEAAPGSPKKDDSAPKLEAPTSGYFELANKLNLFCCVKVFYGGDGSDVSTLWEIARPSYTAIPPNGLVSGRFDASQPFIEIVLLLGNPHPTESGEIVHDTQVLKKVSKCAAVENFRRYMVFRVESAGHNVLLKFKGDTLLEPRLGTSVGRVGIFGKLGLKNAEEPKDVINFDTNVPASSIRLFCASAGAETITTSPTTSPR